MKQVSGTDAQTDLRKRRVQRLKRMILLVLVTSILTPTVLCMVLFGRVHSMEKQLQALMTTLEEMKQAEPMQQTQEEGNSGFILDEQEVPMEPRVQNEVNQAETEEERPREVYLTFDDGPSSQTDEILDILAEYDVKATFFVVGKTDEKSQEAYRRIVEEGHTLAMHSYSHKYDDIYTSVEGFAEDFTKLQEYLYEVTGVWSRYTRFPGGSSNTVSDLEMEEFIGWLNEQGITYYDWNVSSGDAAPGGISAKQILENCTGNWGKHQTIMILMHDAASKKTTVEALPELIETILAMENTVILPITDDTEPIQHVKLQENE